MPLFQNSPYSTMDTDILVEEYQHFQQTIRQYSIDTPYYVYAIMDSRGLPFYIGKGKNKRLWSHLQMFISRKMKNTKLLAALDSLFPDPPILHLLVGNLDEESALQTERNYITEYGRQIYGGKLINVMPGGLFSYTEMSSIGGKIGGKTTRARNAGIFSPDYDRGAQTRSNWQLGLMDHVDFEYGGHCGGTKTRENKSGIFREDLQVLRSKWAKIGAAALAESGNRGGVCSEKWRKEHREQVSKICSDGGKIGGKKVGSMFWWNDGIINKKGFESPGENWVRGQLLSEKKRASLFGRKKESHE